MRLHKRIQVISALFMLGVVGVIDLAALVESSTAKSLPEQPTLMARASRRRVKFRVGVRASRRRAGGFSRSASCNTQQAITALVPPPQSQEKVDDSKENLIDKTTLARPTFFIYVPAIPDAEAQFVLQNQDKTIELHNIRFDLTGKSGIVAIPLPASAAQLEVGQQYNWRLTVDCGNTNTMVVGLIERVQAPAIATESDRLAALAEQGFWQDTLTALGQQLYKQPNDPNVKADWTSLMEDAGLPQFKQAQIVQVVTRSKD